MVREGVVISIGDCGEGLGKIILFCGGYMNS